MGCDISVEIAANEGENDQVLCIATTILGNELVFKLLFWKFSNIPRNGE